MIHIYSYITLVMAIILEGMTHGTRDRLLTDNGAPSIYAEYVAWCHKLQARWHSLNVAFIAMLVVSSCLMMLNEALCYINLEVYLWSKDMLLDALRIAVYVVVMRFALFSPVRNIAYGEILTYVGKSSVMDKGYRKILFKYLPQNFIILLRIALFIMLTLYMLLIYL